MTEPTKKAPALNAFLGALVGKGRVETIKENKCMTCLGEAKNFRDAVSEREYAISGMCQACQDSVFGKGD